jgi:hypothetical protein
MSAAALVTWLVTALIGLFLLAIWLIEYDPEFQSAAATRLPVPVISAHGLLAICGLVIWGIYLITDQRRAAWAAALILIAVALLGITMAIRWIGVYQENPGRSRTATARPAAAALEAGRAPVQLVVPPERHFPLPVVVSHGIFAAVTIVLVVLAALGAGTS